MTDRPPALARGPTIRNASTRLARPGLSLLVDELVRRFGTGTEPVQLTLRALPADAARSLADLLGIDRLPGTEFRLPVDRLLRSLGLSSTGALREVLESLRGPLPDRRRERLEVLVARNDLWRWLSEQTATVDLGLGPDRLEPWVNALRATGIRGGLAGYRRRLESAVAVLRALPSGGLPLASFAADLLGDPHALDHGRALAGMVLDAVAIASGEARLATAESGRLLWERVGVAPDPLSSTVLTLGLPGGPDTPLTRWLAAAAGSGEPVVVTLANLRRWPVPPLPAGVRLYVVENPSLVAQAANGPVGPPIVCSSGRPTVATLTLIRQLTAAGATAFQHADFDPAGLSISAWLAANAGTVPWRMDSGDYHRDRPHIGPTVTGVVPDTPWDPALRDALAEHRVPLYEEQIRGDLLAAMRSI